MGENILLDYIARMNAEAGQNLGKLGALYRDSQGQPTLNPALWSTTAADAERDLSRDLTGAMMGTVNWYGGAAPAAMQKFGDNITADVFAKPDLLTLHRVVVPEAQRGQGIGSDFMKTLTQTADEAGQKVSLSPSADFGGSKSRLIEFYRRYGFVPNKGRARDFEVSESMIRPARPLIGPGR